MVIEKVHGLRATNISMHDRFTMLARNEALKIAIRQQQEQRRNSMGSFTQNLNYSSRLTGQQFNRRWNMQAKRAVTQRLGTPQTGLRKFGSEGNLPRLQRASSLGNLSQSSVKNRVSWRQPNGHLNRSASFSNLSSATWRSFRRRGGGQRKLRGRFRGRGRGNVNVTSRYTRATFGKQQQQQQNQRPRQQVTWRVWGGPRGKKGITRKDEKPQVTKEDLDRQLDQYMAGTKAALDLELDNYMKNVMEIE